MMIKKLIVITGVSGSGKTTIGQLLATQLKAQFLDADDYHDSESIAMMRDNIPLTDTQRIPWVKRLINACRGSQKECGTVVLGYSGLKRHHREMFRNAKLIPLYFWLDVPNEVLTHRLNERSGHFVGADFLAGQLAAFEHPAASETDIVKIQANSNHQKVITEITNYLEKQNQ